MRHTTPLYRRFEGRYNLLLRRTSQDEFRFRFARIGLRRLQTNSVLSRRQNSGTVLNQILRQEPKRGRTAAEQKQIRDYREAVKAAAAGEVGRSFEKLEKLGAVVECGFGEQSNRLCDGYLDIAERGESAIVVSQTRAEVREIMMPFVNGFANAG